MLNFHSRGSLCSRAGFYEHKQIVSPEYVYHVLSRDVASGSDITPSNTRKIDKLLVVYRFRNVT